MPTIVRNDSAEASTKEHKSTLPRATDLLPDVLALQAGSRNAENVRLFILDAEDAFWPIHLHPSELKCYWAELQCEYG